MPLTTALSSEEKAKVKSSISSETSKILFATIARVYYAYPQPHKWSYAGLQGALAFVLDATTNSMHFKLVDLQGTRGVIWEHELYVNLELLQDRPFFHSFAGDKCMIAFVYADEVDAKTLYKKVKNSQTTNGSKTKVEKKRKPSRRGKINKSMISAPQKGSFIHVAHMGYDAELGFTSKGVDPSWTTFISDLENKVGRDVVEREIEYIKKFVRDFPEEQRPQSKKATKSADAPPPPRPRRSQVNGSAPPPPPPIASKPNGAPPPPSRPPVPSRPQQAVSKPPPPPRRPASLAQNNSPPPTVRSIATSSPLPPRRPSVTHAPPTPVVRSATTSTPPPVLRPTHAPPPPPSRPHTSESPSVVHPPPPPPPPPPSATSDSAAPPPPPPPAVIPLVTGETPPSTPGAIPAPQPGRSNLLASIQGKGVHSLRKTDGNPHPNETPREGGSTNTLAIAAAAAGAGVGAAAASSGGGDLTTALAAALLERNKRLGESDDDDDDDDDEWD